MPTTSDLADKELMRVISEVLHYVWDPIGVSGIPQARDEYNSYTNQVFSFLRAGESDTVISGHLENIVDSCMGLPSRKERSDETASLLTDWRDFQEQVGV